MAPKNKRKSGDGSGGPKSKAKKGEPAAIPADSLRLPHMSLLETWLTL